MLSNASLQDAADRLIPVSVGLDLFTGALSAADVDSRLERTQAVLRGLLGFLDSLKLIDPSASGFPSAAIIEWKKRELAISDFDAGLRSGDVRATVCNPASGQRTDVGPLEFYTASRLDLTIRSGVVQGLPGEAIARFNGYWLEVQEPDIRGRLAQFQKKTQVPKFRAAACREWLTALMRAHPERPPMPQKELMRAAKDRFGCSQRQFKLLLQEVRQDTGIKWPLGRPPRNSSAPAALRG